MARGKNSAKAENRERAAQEREAPFRRKIAELERKCERLDKANLEQQAVHIEETRKMRTLIASGTSEKVEELEERLEKQTEDLKIALGALDEIQGNWQRVAKKMIEFLRAEYGHDQTAAVQVFMTWFGEDPNLPLVVMDGEEQIARKHGPKGVMAMRRARRRAGDPPLAIDVHGPDDA